jgi:hypothetical protein
MMLRLLEPLQILAIAVLGPWLAHNALAGSLVGESLPR